MTDIKKNQSWILLLLLSICCGLSSAQVSPNGKYLVYVGTYTKHDGRGIYAYRFDATTGKLDAQGLAVKSEDPSFLAVDPTHKFLYAVNEVDKYNGHVAGAVSAFVIDKQTGKLSLLSQVSARDPGPAYISLDRTGKYALVANYPLGSVAVFPILKNGAVGEVSDFVRHHGSGPDKERQASPHGHAIETSLDDRFAVAADLGLDELIVYPFNARTGKLGASHVTKMKPGAGPRHIVFSPDGHFVYLISEMGNTVTAFAYEAANGILTELQTISTLPAGFSGSSTTAEIAIDPKGNFLYGSNRGDDSLVVFAIDHSTGKLSFVQRVSTQGKTPRNFALDPTGHWLVAANEDSNNVVEFRVDEKSGRLTPAGQVIEVPEPVCVVFVPVD